MGADRDNSAQSQNARTHSRKQIRQIAASMRKFGFLNPLIVDDENMILAGHGRLEGARLEGMAHVPIVRFVHLSEAQKRAYVIADNKIAEQAGWDRELLSIELGELIDLLPIEGSTFRSQDSKRARSICCSRTWRVRSPARKMSFRPSRRRR